MEVDSGTQPPSDMVKKRVAMTVGTIRRKFPGAKMLRSLAQAEGELNGPERPQRPLAARPKQTEAMRAALKRSFRKESLFRAVGGFTGYGVQGDLVLEVGDLVGVIKKADPCGDPLKWFVDNGCKFVLYFGGFVFG